MAKANFKATPKRKSNTATKSKPAPIEVRFPLDLGDFELEIAWVGELIKAADCLVSGVIEDLGTNTEAVSAVVVSCAALERAAERQEDLGKNLDLLSARLREVGVAVTREEEVHHE